MPWIPPTRRTVVLQPITLTDARATIEVEFVEQGDDLKCTLRVVGLDLDASAHLCCSVSRLGDPETAFVNVPLRIDAGLTRSVIWDGALTTVGSRLEHALVTARIKADDE